MTFDLLENYPLKKRMAKKSRRTKTHLETEMVTESQKALGYSRDSFSVENDMVPSTKPGKLHQNVVNALHNEICNRGLTP